MIIDWNALSSAAHKQVARAHDGWSRFNNPMIQKWQNRLAPVNRLNRLNPNAGQSAPAQPTRPPVPPPVEQSKPEPLAEGLQFRTLWNSGSKWDTPVRGQFNLPSAKDPIPQIDSDVRAKWPDGRLVKPSTFWTAYTKVTDQGVRKAGALISEAKSFVEQHRNLRLF